MMFLSRRAKRPSLLAMLGFIFVLTVSYAKAEPFEFGESPFETAGSTDEIPDQNVTAVVQDKDGFIWVGTPSGLFRYDGFKFRRVNESLATGFLDTAFIRSLLVASDGRLWIGTDADGLFAFNPAKPAFAQFRNAPADGESLVNDSVTALAEDALGGIWVGTRGGLDHLPRGKASFNHFRDGSLASSEGRDQRILALLVTRAGDLWIGTWNGLYRRMSGSGLIERVQFSGSARKALMGELVTSLLELRDGRLALGTARSGAYLLSADANQLIHLAPPRQLAPGDPMVQSMIQPNAQELWLAGFGGIVVMSTDEQKLIRYFRHDVSIASSLAHSQVRTLIQDRDGYIWIGGYGGGLQRHNPDNRGIRVLRHSPKRPAGLSSPNVSAVLELDNGEIWLGTRDNGIDIIDRKRGLIGGIRADGSSPGMLNSAQIASLAQTHDRSVWIGTLHGLHRTLPETRAAISVQTPKALNDATIRKLLAARDGSLWIGSNIGLANWTPASNSIDVISGIGGDVVSGDINALVEAADTRLWVGCGAAGLYTLAPGSEQLQQLHLRSKTGQAWKLNIVGLLIDHEGRLWIDSSQGLFRLVDWSGEQGTLDDVGARLGLAGRPMGANLLEDAVGRIWTQRFVFDPKNESIRELVAADGAYLGTPWFRAYAKTRDGLLLFGGSKGLMVADPANFRPASQAAPLKVTDVAIDGQTIAGWSTPAVLRVPAGARSFSVEFAALDYSAPRRTRYEYRLRDYETTWNLQNAGRRSADYGNVPPGNYQLHVRAFNRDGISALNELSVPILIEAAYWQTRWFATLLAVMGILLTYGGYRLRTAAIRASARDLELLVEHRTHELAIAKERAEQALEEVKGAQRQLVAAEKMASLGNLVAGVAHEINTPIGVGVTAASHLDDALQRFERESASNSPETREFSALARQCTNMILRNLDRADKLIKSFKQVAVDQSSEQMREVVLSKCLHDIVASLQPTLKRTPHRIAIDCPDDIKIMTFPGSIYQIIANLILNSLAHGFDADVAGDITLEASAIAAENGTKPKVRILYRDNGRGMTPNVLEHVFDPFFTTRRGQGGTGLGMHITFNLVTQMLKGSVACDSTPGHGVQFEISLPIDVRE